MKLQQQEPVYYRLGSKVINKLDEFEINGIEIDLERRIVKVNSSIQEKISNWEKQHISINTLLYAKGLSKEEKSKVKRRLSSLEQNDWQSLFFKDKYIDIKDIDAANKIIEKVKEVEAKENASAQIKEIPRKKVKKILGSLSYSELESKYNEHSEYVSLKYLLGEYEVEENVRLTNVLRKEYIELVKDTNNWNDKILLGEEALIKNAKKHDVLVRSLNKKELENFLKTNLKRLPKDNYEYIWRQVDINISMAISKTLAVKSGGPINSRTLNLIALFAKLDKKASSITDSEVYEIRNECTNRRTYLDVRKCLQNLSEIIGRENTNYSLNTIDIRAFKKSISTREEKEPYTYDQFIRLGQMLFDLDYIKHSSIIEKALNNDGAAQVLLYMAMHYVCAWRRGSILNLKGPLILEIDDYIRDIKAGIYESERYRQVWLQIERVLYLYELAEKNNGQLITMCPEEFRNVMGLYILLVFYHKEKSGRKKLLTNEVQKKSNYIYLYGSDYDLAIGPEPFGSRRMNKELLLVYCNAANEVLGTSIRTLPEMVAAYIRGHKLDYEHGQKTIFHYIPHLSDGYTVDEIAEGLFLVGTLGHYKNALAKMLQPDYKNLDFMQRCTRIDEMNIEPAKIEMQIEAISLLNASVSKVGFNRKYDSFIKRLMDDNNANEKSVRCLYEALTGRRNPNCIGKEGCFNCGEKTPEHEYLCKYGIYSWQYIYNLLYKVNKIKERQKRTVELLGQIDNRSNEYFVVINTIKIQQEKIEYIDNCIFDFIDSIPIELKLREYLIELYEKDGINYAMPDIRKLTYSK